MKRAMLYHRDTGKTVTGAEELIGEWRRDPRTLILLDLENNPADAERALLIENFGLHPLAVQDAQRDRHPPKLEVFDDHTFILLKGLGSAPEGIEFSTIQLALFIGERFLVTRHSGPSPSVDRLFAEIGATPELFARGADALAVRLARILVGRYLSLLLALEPRLEHIEAEIVANPHDSVLAELLGYKTELKKYRRVFLYHEHIFGELRSGKFPGISAERHHELNDVYEHQERAVSLAGLYYELASDLVDGYISLASHRLNQIMKVLTIVTVVFVPLGFLAGIYGMNFDNMPELHSESGYYIVIGVMVLIAVTLLAVFKIRRWL
ncbi:MAG: magnesium transporter [Gammaproteobacteria bacterium]|nr:MAG: magnesium transporter [Gammaproteobacteria bacterium]TND02282.1 MAG: magnesium transporter [Gammaproteobacteria bacterium]